MQLQPSVIQVYTVPRQYSHQKPLLYKSWHQAAAAHPDHPDKIYLRFAITNETGNVWLLRTDPPRCFMNPDDSV